MPTGICRLCRAEANLQLSHVLPAFVFRWQRQSSGNGHLRGSDAPNRRVQDGEKKYWLCSDCEGLLSISEGDFANKLFHPYIEGTKKSVRYSRWLMHFCISVSWRVLQFYQERNDWTNWPSDSLQRIQNADTVWREVLLGKRPHPGLLQQHMLPVDQFESATGTFAPNINRYLMRAIQMDFCRSGPALFTYAKLGRFIILGFVHEPNLSNWRGTKVQGNDGVIEPRRYVVPRALGDYLNEKASRMAEALNGISDTQQEKIDKSFRENLDHYIGSDAYTAMTADLRIFGDAAFAKR